MLYVPDGALDTIDHNHGRSAQDAMLAVFTAWKKTRCSPFTWNTILDVLASTPVGHKDIAYDIKRMLSHALKGQSSK